MARRASRAAGAGHEAEGRCGFAEKGQTARPPTAKPQAAAHAAIHRAILTGSAFEPGPARRGHEYTVAGGGKANLWPGSGVFHGRPKWIVAAEAGRDHAPLPPLPARGSIPAGSSRWPATCVKRTYSDVALGRATGPRPWPWSGSRCSGSRSSPAGRSATGRSIPNVSRQLLIEHGLVEGDMEPKPAFLAAQRGTAGRDGAACRPSSAAATWSIDAWDRYDFYDARLPAEVYDGAHADPLAARPRPENARRADDDRRPICCATSRRRGRPRRFPIGCRCGDWSCRWTTASSRATEHDGVTVSVPLEALGQLDAAADRVARAGPVGREGAGADPLAAEERCGRGSCRRRTTARQAAAELRHGEGDFAGRVAAVLSRIGGVSRRARRFRRSSGCRPSCG